MAGDEFPTKEVMLWQGFPCKVDMGVTTLTIGGVEKLLSQEAIAEIHSAYKIVTLGEVSEWYHGFGWHDFNGEIYTYLTSDNCRIIRFHHYGGTNEPALYRRIEQWITRCFENNETPIVACCHQDNLPLSIKQYSLFPDTDGYGRLMAVMQEGVIKLIYSYYVSEG